MKLIDLDQRSKEWHKWRTNGIGSSDISVLMGSNPYSTPLKLWEEKCGFRGESKVTPAMRHGIEHEDEARIWANNHLSIGLRPVCVEDDESHFFKASLDGYDETNQIIAEIKCPVSREILDAARNNGKVPEYWSHQLQWSACLTKSKRSIFVVFDHRYGDCIIIDLKADKKLHEKMKAKAREFWKQVQCGEAPKPEKTDYVVVVNPNLEKILNEYSSHDEAEKRAKEMKSALKDQISGFGDNQNFCAYGYKMTLTSPPQMLDVKQMERDGIDLSKYRKRSSDIQRYSIRKSKE